MQCETCQREFKTIFALNAHNIVHQPERRLSKQQNCKQSQIMRGLKLKDEHNKLYLVNPKTCVLCAEIIPYKQRANRFCSATCSTTFYNAKRRQAKKLKEDEYIEFQIESIKNKKCKIPRIRKPKKERKKAIKIDWICCM